MRSTHRHRSLLGIALEDRRLTAAALRRTGRGVEVRQTLTAGMALDPLANDPELVGSEIQNLLAAAGIREKHCVLCLPLKRALTMQTTLPDLSEPDLTSYIRTQAEREFPLPLEHLSLSSLRSNGTNGTRRALVAGVPLAQLEALLKALRHAGLQPLGVTLGVTSLLHNAGARQEAGVVLLAWNGSIDLAVEDQLGLLTLRSIADLGSIEPGQADIPAEAVARQLRITFGQLEPKRIERIRAVQVFGPKRLADALFTELAPFGRQIGLTVEAGDMASAVVGSPEILSQASPAVVASAAEYLAGTRPELEFLPPRSSPFRRIVGVLSRRSAMLPAVLALVLLLLIVGAFGQQHVRLSRLRSDWRAIASNVTALETLQGNVRLFRPWYDDSIPSLQIARTLTEAFPEDGAVWAKTMEIRRTAEGRLIVSCSGRARTNAEWLRMLDRLRARTDVGDLRFQQVSGTQPLQFSLSFLWQEGVNHGQ